MTLVTSFDQHDLPISATDDRGTDMLRRYIEYVTTEGRHLPDLGGTNMPLNPFEQDIRTALENRGISIIPQWGASQTQYRIDLVARHPEKPGRLVLAIECDGRTYHTSPTARDRDRLRQQHLEALGWKFHRIWSTDWFMRREQEIQRAVDAFERAWHLADEEDARTKVPPVSIDKLPEELQAVEDIDSILDSRGPRPSIVTRSTIDEYSPTDLQQLLLWLASDRRLRTDEEIVGEMVSQLGFQRRGPRIVARIEEAIATLRLSGLLK